VPDRASAELKAVAALFGLGHDLDHLAELEQEVRVLLCDIRRLWDIDVTGVAVPVPKPVRAK